MRVEILDAEIEDLEEILSLQKTAYRSEAELYNDFTIPPLHQSLDAIREEFKNHVFLKVSEKDKIVGSVRGNEKDGTCFVGKLIVDPDCQDRGIGTQLMKEIETRFCNAERFELFTGNRSEKNLHLYEKLGYRPFKERRITDKVTLVFLEKLNSPRRI